MAHFAVCRFTLLAGTLRISQRPSRSPTYLSQPLRYASLQVQQGEWTARLSTAGESEHQRTAVARQRSNTIMRFSSRLVIAVERHEWQTVDHGEIQAALNNRSIVHLTCHGHFDSVEPARSALLIASHGQRPSTSLSQQSVRERQQHSFSVRQILGVDTRADLITLRACSAGVNDTAEGVSSVAEALLSSGARSVVASLWNVDQETSRQFIGNLYQALLDSDEPRWMALWRTQQDMINEPVDGWKRHPYHWAPLALLGDWR